MANQGAAANRRPAGQSDGSGELVDPAGAGLQPTGRFRRRSLILIVSPTKKGLEASQ